MGGHVGEEVGVHGHVPHREEPGHDDGDLRQAQQRAPARDAVVLAHLRELPALVPHCVVVACFGELLDPVVEHLELRRQQLHLMRLDLLLSREYHLELDRDEQGFDNRRHDHDAHAHAETHVVREVDCRFSSELVERFVHLERR